MSDLWVLACFPHFLNDRLETRIWLAFIQEQLEHFDVIALRKIRLIDETSRPPFILDRSVFEGRVLDKAGPARCHVNYLTQFYYTQCFWETSGKNSISGFSQECTVTAGLRNVSRCVYTHPRGIKSSKNNEACDIFLTFKIPHATMRSTKTSRSLVISFYLEPDKALGSSNRGLCSLLAVPNNRKHGFHN